MEGEDREHKLLDSVRRDAGWIKLPHAAMRQVGPATQTLAGLLKVTNRETFVPASDIAMKARVPLATVRKHLPILHNAGWIVHQGRQRTRAGILRRTATIALAPNIRPQLEPYGVLPWWACGKAFGRDGGKKIDGRLSWASRAVLSLVVSRIMSFTAIHQADDLETDARDYIENVLGGDDRFVFSLSTITESTGLTRESAIEAKRDLMRRRIILWTRNEDRFGPDLLIPNWNFVVIERPVGNGFCKLFLREDKPQ